jgi:hypothetical protein
MYGHNQDYTNLATSKRPRSSLELVWYHAIRIWKTSAKKQKREKTFPQSKLSPIMQYKGVRRIQRPDFFSRLLQYNFFSLLCSKLNPALGTVSTAQQNHAVQHIDGRKRTSRHSTKASTNLPPRFKFSCITRAPEAGIATMNK